ncbi:hypothetical protein [Streptomyces lavendulae]|uniref:hypothetical protein n=1 Tax=Streptomyces lavendulae TaxID=1914 RepID=UPI0033E0987B
MTRTTTAGVRRLLVAAVALFLITCTVGAWAMPHTRPTPAAAAPFEAGAGQDCHLTAGPSAAYCGMSRMPGPASEASVWPAGLNPRTALLLFSALGVSAAIGLVSSAGRRL